MKREPVDSSDLKSVGYDAGAMILELEFHKGGSIYRYFDVPSILNAALMSAPSKGRFFNARIRNVYRCERVVDRD